MAFRIVSQQIGLYIYEPGGIADHVGFKTWLQGALVVA
jgi:hypothetical protein